MVELKPPSGGSSPLPAGTVTFLFTDVQGNTPLWERHPHAMEAALEIHNAILREAIEAHGGIVVKIVGDEFQSVFPTAPQALAAALEVQRGLFSATWNEVGPLRVRMGIHTGTAQPIPSGDDYAVSHTLNRGHRVMEAGHGGQILLSQESTDLCERNLPPDTYLKYLGDYQISGWQKSERLYQIVVPDLPSQFPPLKWETRPKHNLPVQLTSFIGREKELEQIETLMDENALVTVIGPGGVGKTRIALQVAKTKLGKFQDGIWLVDLAVLSDPAAVFPNAARAIGMHVDIGPQAQEALLNYCQERQLLLVLNNCEHLVEACARLAEAILTACPQVKILATSREILGVAGEAIYLLPPFPAPNPGDSLEQLSQYEAVLLFVERAAKIQPGFALTSHNTAVIGQICAQLDGIPLAIELAAAWVRVLPEEQIRSRLQESLDYLRGGSRTGLPRHQTMRACLDWSYNLLTQPEQAFLQALSVFAGSWTLEAAEAVCAGNSVSTKEVLESLDQLVMKSLLLVEHHLDSETRYRLLEPVRQYAQEKLHYAGNTEVIRDRHLAYYQGLTAQAAPHLRARKQIEWLRRLERELANIRQALDWSYSLSGPVERLELGMRLAACLKWFWHIRCRHEEGFLWLQRLLDLEKQRRGDQAILPSTGLARAKALIELYDLKYYVPSNFPAHGFRIEVDEIISLIRQFDPADKQTLAYTKSLYTSLVQQSKYLEAERLLEELLVEFKSMGDLFMVSGSLGSLGFFYKNIKHDYGLAREYFEQAIHVTQEIGDRDYLPLLFWWLGDTALRQGNIEEARSYSTKARLLIIEVEEDLLYVAELVFGLLGSLACTMGDYIQAEEDFKHRDLIQKKHQGMVGLFWSDLGLLALSQGDYDKARNILSNTLQLAESKKQDYRAGRSMWALGELAWATGELDQANDWFVKILQSSNPTLASSAEAGLAKIALSREDWLSAADHFSRAIDLKSIQYRLLDESSLLDYYALELVAVLASSQHSKEAMQRLMGAADADYRYHRLVYSPPHRAMVDQVMDECSSALSDERFKTIWEEGKAMDLNQALEYALQVIRNIQSKIVTNGHQI